jgi:copper chaperone CopZ
MTPLSPSHQTYVVAGMTCEHCRVAVTQEVTQVAGVASVDVDLDTKLVRVDGTGVDQAAVIAAVDEAGYDAVAA